MATLPTVQSSTVAAIYAAREAKRAERGNYDSVGISMSELGSDCDRALWFSLRWASDQEFIDGKKDSIFETGNVWEDRLIADVRSIPGVTLATVDPETGKQWKVYSHGGHVRGRLDGDELLGLPEAPKTLHVLECKSHKGKSFDELVKKKLRAAKPAHWYQCQKYMQLRGKTRCLYLAVNKDTDERYAERVEYDATAILQLDARLEHVINSNRAPPRIATGPEKWPCMFCRHKEVCHTEKFGRSHCRTCVHATPIIGEGKDATWLCEKHKKTLTLDEQRAGCHAHLFLPDVVPGAQADAGDDWIAYDLRDGSRWVDQEKKAPAEPAPEPEAEDRYRYWFKPSTGEVWSTEFASHDSLVRLGEVEELTAEEFEKAQAYYADLDAKGEAQEAQEALLNKAGIPT